MKKYRNIKKVFQTTVFTFIAFFIFGVINVDAKTVSVDRNSFLVKFSDQTSDVIRLSDNIDLSDLDTRYAVYIYKDKTIDLNGYDLTITERGIQLWYYENATVKFIDSSNAKSGRIIREHKDGSMFADSLIGISNEDTVNATDTFLVFDGVKIYREVDNNSIKVIAPESTISDKTINKISFINTDITNFVGLNDGREAKDFYYENVTFKRGVVNQGFLLNSSTKTVNNVISDNSEIINEKYDGTYKSTYERNTVMSSVKTSNDVIKVRYLKGVSVSNVNFAFDYGYTPASQNITIKNSGQESVTITNVSAGANFVVSGPESGVSLAVDDEDTSWSIAPKAGLGGGTYVDTITVTADGKTYTSTVTLTVKEVDSEGNDVVYVSTKDELNSAIETGTKYIKFADDISYYTGFVQIPVNGDVTIDLNGKTLSTRTGYFGLNYQDAATIKITDTSSAKSGKIIEDGYGTSAYGGIIQLTNSVTDTTKECNFIIDGVNVTSTSKRDTSMIFVGGDNKLHSVKLVNSLFSNYSSVLDGRNIDKITFENVKATAAEFQRIYLVDNRYELTFGEIITDDSEVVYLNADGSLIRIPDNSTTVKYDTLQNGQSIQVRYKSGFNVTTESKTISYSDSIDGYFVIDITNRGLTDNNIFNVSIDNTNFELVHGSSTIVSPGATISSWKIKVKDGVTLEKGVYTVNISVEDSEHNIYRGTFTLTVNSKTLSNLEIVNIPSTVTYGDTISPKVGGADKDLLNYDDYEISYEVLDNGSYVRITDKPKNVGKYRAVLKPRAENYTFDEKYFEFEIVAKDISGQITVGIDSVTYDGNEKRPGFTPLLNGTTPLSEGSDYTYTYSDNVTAGNGKLTLSPVDGSNYTFAVFNTNFTIYAKSLNASDVNVTLTNTSYKYTGSPIEPQPDVKDRDKTLVLGTDYTLDYEGDNTNSGDTAKVVVKGIGNYKDVVRVSFVITPKETQTVSFGESSITKTYGDDSFANTASTTGNGSISYTSSNTSVAEVDSEGRVTIKGAGSAEITATASETDDYGVSTAKYILTVNPKEINFRARVNNKVYDGNNTAVVGDIYFTGLVGSDALTLDTDYRIVSAVFENSNVGTNKNVSVKIELLNNNYTLVSDTAFSTANIGGVTILDSDVTLGSETLTYDGNEKYISVSVKVNGVLLTKDTDYQLVYSNNINAGVKTAEVKVIGIGNYTGTIVKKFSIDKKSITLDISDITDVVFNGLQHKPSITIKDSSTSEVLEPNRDYTLNYDENTNAGTGTINIYSISTSNYQFGMTTKNFNITKYNIIDGDVTLEYTSVVFDNNAKYPNVTVKMGSEVIPPIEYNVDYMDNTNVGTATVKVTIKADSDDFTGEVTKNFEIVNKASLTISGINDQQVTYTGSPVVLVGTLQVSNGINPSRLNEKWYKGSTEISKPTNVGVYKVVYSYEDETYIGSKTINVEITRKTSTVPSVNLYKGVVGDKLSTITLPNGFNWVDGNITVTAGNKEYNATYTTNNDEANYTTENVVITVYGKSKVNLNTSVNGMGGTISSSKSNILEGTTESITFTPNTGFVISKVEVNGVDKTSSVVNNKLDVVIGNNDVNVVVTYKVIEYTITINGVEHATIDPSGIIKVDYNTNKTFTIMADLGYKLVSVKVNGVERISDIVNDKLTLENILADAEVVVVVQRNVYEVIEGSNQKYTITKNNEARFRIDAEYIKFERSGKVYVDDVLVDPSNYTSESGSTIIILKKEYVDTLSEGVHTLRVEFTDGEATTMFTIAKLSSEENPNTGDNIGFYILTGIISIIGLAGAGAYIYRRKQTN